MTRRRPHIGLTLAGALAPALLAACSYDGAASPSSASSDAAPSPAAAASTPSDAVPDRTGQDAAVAGRGASSVGRPRTPEPPRSHLSVPALGLRSVPVVRYQGSPDDAEGTDIQNRGPAASPRGPSGGVGPGEIGNFIVTGHRTSHSAPFRDLPNLRPGELVRVRTGAVTTVYRITATRATSFRSQRSLTEQSAAVPGRPGVGPTRPMITLSTCATPEDHAVGNFWADRFGNPEHRIDKIGVLVRRARARA